MNSDQALASAALRFVNLLTPGNFESASQWLSESCEYTYADKMLRGETIIQSFKSNHENACGRLDKIEYQDGSVEKIDGRAVSVLVTDRITVGNRCHNYRDRLIVTFGEGAGLGSVIRIEN